MGRETSLLPREDLSMALFIKSVVPILNEFSPDTLARNLMTTILPGFVGGKRIPEEVMISSLAGKLSIFVEPFM